MKALRTILSVVLAVALLPLGSHSALGYTGSYDDFTAITGHVTLAVPKTLAIASPAKATTTAAASYYITGSSNPSQPLYLNGDEVPNRGIYGSWGVFVPLYMGENTYTVKQDGSTASLTITRVQALPATATAMTALYPQADSGYNTGDTLKLSCTAPAGADVWAMFGEIKVPLTQQSTKADEGTPVKYIGETVVGGVTQYHRIEGISYSMSLGGSTKTQRSSGGLHLYPPAAQIAVRIADTAATSFADEAGKEIAAVLRGGGVDSVDGQNDQMLLLGMGSWIPKGSVEFLPPQSVHSVVTATAFTKTAYGERISLSCKDKPVVTSSQGGNKLTLKLHHTSGLTLLPLEGSKLFSEATVTPDGDGVLLELTLAAGQALWGHTVEYADGTTSIYCKYPPAKSSNSQKPLSGIVVGLDAGHGGSDTGAIGVLAGRGPVEKDITRATAVAVQKRLETLGAKVVLPAYSESEKTSFTGRMEEAVAAKADFYISLHCNSTIGNELKAQGTETFYYYNRSKPLAEALQKELTTATARTNRGVKGGSFRVTMNTLTPAVLLELGFMSHPQEYDRMCSPDEIYKTANAIGDALVGLLE